MSSEGRNKQTEPVHQDEVPEKQETPVKQETKPAEQETESTKPEVEPPSEKEAEQLKEWIKNSISLTNDVTEKDREIKKWSKVAEENFLPTWKSVASEHLQLKEEKFDGSDGSYSLSIYDATSLADYLKGNIELYGKLYVPVNQSTVFSSSQTACPKTHTQ